MKQVLIFALFAFAQSAFCQNGIVWQAPVSVAASSFGKAHPRIAMDRAGNPLILWGKEGDNKTYFSRWSGGAFTAPLLMNPANIPVFTASWAGPDLAAHGDTVYVTFKETPEDVAHPIFVTRSFDGGASFSAPVQVDFIADSISRFTTRTTDDVGNPVVAFMKFNPGFGQARYVVARSQDFGASFSSDVLASGFSGGTVCDCCPATVLSSGNTVAVLYRDNLNNIRNAWAGISIDDGQTFQKGIEVDNTNWFINSCPSSGPDGFLLGDSLYTVFMSAATGNTRCYLSRVSVSNAQAGPSEPITGGQPGISAQNFPRIANDGATAAIVLKQTANGVNQLALFFDRDINDGAAPVFESVANSNVANADVAMREGAIFVVWEDVASGTVKFRRGNYSSVSTKNLTGQEVPKVYPNPVSEGVFTVEFDQKMNGVASYELTDAAGQKLVQQEVMLANGRFRMDVSALANGIYFLKVTLDGQLFSAKFVRQ